MSPAFAASTAVAARALGPSSATSADRVLGPRELRITTPTGRIHLTASSGLVGPAPVCFRNSLAAKPAVCRPSVSTIPGLIAFTRMSRGQLLGEGPGDGVDRRLGGAVDRCVRRRDRAGARADVDDAADQALGLGPLDESTDLGAPERVG